MSNLPTVKGQVLNCLERFPATRDNMMFLVVSVWKNHYKDDFVDYLYTCTRALEEEPSEWMKGEGKMSRLPNFETIRRTCQQIQNTDGKFPPCEDTKKARDNQEQDWREHFR